MFGRSSPPGDLKQPPPVQKPPLPQGHAAPTYDAPPVQPQPPQPQPVATAISASSILGDDVAIVGERITIVSKARIQIDGEIHGNINGQEVVVGPNGRVDGTITARRIEVRGAVNGALKAASVTLQPSAKVDGDIHHQSLAISEGAHFDGRVRRPKDAAELEPNLDVAALRNAIQSQQTRE